MMLQKMFTHESMYVLNSLKQLIINTAELKRQIKIQKVLKAELN